MSRRVDLKDFFNKISLGQQISAADKRFKTYTGSDVKIAKQIATLTVLEDNKMIAPESVKLIKELLIEQNKATFASSEKTDNFTKLSLYTPKAEKALNLEPKSS